jgi:hypothetical protein
MDTILPHDRNAGQFKIKSGHFIFQISHRRRQPATTDGPAPSQLGHPEDEFRPLCLERVAYWRVLQRVPGRPGTNPRPQPSPTLGWGRFFDTRHMNSMERCFVALTVVGSLGVIAIVIWMLVH